MVPCGSCVGCRAARAADWALRCVHEAQVHERNSFITLTYAKVPSGGGLVIEDLQRFFKRLRKRLEPARVRYFACGEYGEENERPHYHACVFGHGFDDRFLQVREKPPLYRSSLLESVWTEGHSSVGELTYESAAYVARYVMKKLTGLRAEEEYGERRAPFVCMSLKPGVGSKWFDKFGSDVFPADEIVHDGRHHRVPRYYDSKLDPEVLKSFKAERRAAAEVHADDQSDDRLRVRESVVEARLRAFRRKL